MPLTARQAASPDSVKGWRSRIIGEADVAPDQLLAHPMNARRHPNAQRDALDASLDALGWIAPIMVNQRTGHVLDGHARVEQALSRGEATVPVSYVDLTEAEELMALAVYDPISAMAVYDDEALRMLLAEVNTGSAALDAMLASIKALPSKVGLTEPDDVPEERETLVKRGDIYALGMHRLACGDSTARDDAGHGHGTQKPVECMERPIRNHTGDVYEPFAGSGTTIIAAERQGRKCYAMEIEPKYVQVCIDRYEAYSGAKAIKLTDSEARPPRRGRRRADVAAGVPGGAA